MMRKNWRRIVIVVCVLAIVCSGGWIMQIICANNTAKDFYESIGDLIENSANAEEITATPTSPVPPTYEEWLMMREAESEATVEPEAEATATLIQPTVAPTTTPLVTEAPITAQDITEALNRAADEGAATAEYADIAKYGKNIDAETWENIKHMLYYQWLAQNNYEVPEEAAETEKLLLMDFTDLLAINPEVVGWLQSEGTVINYPVAHGEDNDYYLHHLLDGTSNSAGTLFSDMYNDKGFTDQNTIVYGHHMRNDSMFATLVEYKEQAYYDEHPVMLLYTPGATYLVELFAGYIEGDVTSDLPCFQMVFADGESFLSFIDDVKEKSTFDADVKIGEEDKLVTFSTCTYEVYNARYILHGKLTLIAGVPAEPEEPTEEETIPQIAK